MRVPVSAAMAFASAGATEGTADLADAGRRLGRLDQVHLDPRERSASA